MQERCSATFLCKEADHEHTNTSIQWGKVPWRKGGVHNAPELPLGGDVKAKVWMISQLVSWRPKVGMFLAKEMGNM